MANVTAGDVWVLDTAGAIVATGTPVTIWSVLWCCQTLFPCSVRVTDAGGRVIFEGGGSCDRFVAYTQPINCDGLTVSVLTSGKLLVQTG